MNVGVGTILGAELGAFVRSCVGTADDASVGASEGDADIDVVGSIDGFADGPSEPTRLGIVLGA